MKMDNNSLKGDFVHNCMEAIGFGKFQVIMLMSLGLRCFVRGSSNCMLSILQPYLRCHMKLSIFTASWLGTGLAIGRLFGAVLIGRMADKYGRRRSMLCLFSLNTLLSLLNALSSSYIMILITRASIGFAFEAGILVYTYGMELLPIKKRKYLAVIDAFFGLGFLFAIFSAMGILGTVNWRWFVVVNETIPLGICILLVAFLPESPRYLYSQGCRQEAVKSLEKIAVMNGVDLHQVVSESNISREDLSLFTNSKTKHQEADSLESAQTQSDPFITEEAPDNSCKDTPKSLSKSISPIANEERVLQDGEGSQTSLRTGDEISENTFLLQSDDKKDTGANEAQTAANTDLKKTELCKRIFILTILRFVLQAVSGVFMFGSMQFKNPDTKYACGSCSTNLNYRFIITLALALETGFLLSFFMTGKYNRKVALQILFFFNALIAIPFYFNISQWVKVPFFFVATVFRFAAFITVNIYGSEVIPTSHRALATGIESTAGNIGLFIGDFFALYLVHMHYYAVVGTLQGLTIAAILIISVFVIDTTHIPLSDS